MLFIMLLRSNIYGGHILFFQITFQENVKLFLIFSVRCSISKKEKHAGYTS